MGIWDSAKGFLLQLLEWAYSFTGSYGISIILLTILVRLALYPLSKKQMTSMAAIQRIQPRMKVLQQKYGDDKQKLNEEMMKLYREHRVNPLAGCLPLLIQLPIMILLYNALLDKLKMSGGSQSFLGIDLGTNFLHGLGRALEIQEADIGIVSAFTGIFSNPAGLANVGLYLPSLILIIVISVLTWMQQRLSGTRDNPQMATMNKIMPFFMLFICLSLPGGILVYWVTSTLIGVAQQWFIMRKVKIEQSEKPALYKNKPTPGRSGELLDTAVKHGGPEKDDEDDDDEYEYYDDDEEYDDDEYEYYDDEDEEADDIDGRKEDKKR